MIAAGQGMYLMADDADMRPIFYDVEPMAELKGPMLDSSLITSKGILKTSLESEHISAIKEDKLPIQKDFHDGSTLH
ncbi:hypothetical protein Tco_0750456 [Tanacetum coccineum]|uniref:Uncharacterized protein n=1 Tax=Tanacetum coccineum TaxID=301880 RepID=A0ABQ4Z292_9ASTR